MFSNIVVQAGRAFIAAKGRDPEVDGRALADYLLSDEPLGPDERRLLAEMALGNWRRPRGAPTLRWPRKVEIVAAFRAKELELGPRRKTAAMCLVAAQFKLSETTMRSYVAEIEDREKVMAEVIAKYSPNK